jgi:thiol-disulfide isomerase/thioredoxin
MAATPSTMLELGTPMPAFDLPDFNGNRVSSSGTKPDQPILVVFLCPHCPFVRHTRLEIGRFGRDYQSKGLAIFAINSNDTNAFPEDGMEGMREEASIAGYTFPYLRDETQEVAKRYRAACTPDFFLFAANRKLVYRGQLDSSRPRNNIPVTGSDLRAAADAVLAGRMPPELQKPSIGCNIKWKPGNEPEYF